MELNDIHQLYDYPGDRRQIHGSEQKTALTRALPKPSYEAPQYVWPIQFPFPGVLAWATGAILLFFKIREQNSAG